MEENNNVMENSVVEDTTNTINVDKNLLTRRIYIYANDVINEREVKEKKYEQIDLFTNYEELKREREHEKSEKEIQKAMLNIKRKYGKNAIIKGMNLQEGGTTIQRNGQIGGHKG